MSARGAARSTREPTHAPPPCPRCYCQEEVVRPWVGFRVARVLWMVGLAVIVMLAPILASDILVMTPLAVMFLFAGGPLFGLAKRTPTCRACGLERPSPGWHETPCRPMRTVPTSRLKLTATKAAEPGPLAVALVQDDEQSGVRSRPRPPTP